jgi:hypothetical protein
MRTRAVQCLISAALLLARPAGAGEKAAPAGPAKIQLVCVDPQATGYGAANAEEDRRRRAGPRAFES